MSVRLSKFGSRQGFERARRRSRLPARISIKPTRGAHEGERPEEVPQGFTPEAQNFAIDGGSIQPRSGLSQFAQGDTGLDGPALGGLEAFDENNNFYAIAASHRTFVELNSQDVQWEVLDNDTRPSGDTTDFWDTTTIFDDSRDGKIAVFTNDRNLPKFINLDVGVNSISSFTNATSILSKARAVEAFDNRLVWANIEESDVRRPNRVAWSGRGKAQNYSNIGTEAGFEDLVDMAGEITGMVRHQGQMILLGNQEIWRARPRRDTFAFNFVANLRNVGAPFPRTAISTPGGVMFLGQDLELYALSGQDIVPVGPAEEGGDSRIQNRLQEEFTAGQRAFAFYNQTKRTYNLYYSVADDEWPTKSFSYDFDTDSFMFHDYGSEELTLGFDFTDPGTLTGSSTWDQQGTTTWDEISTEWNDFGIEPAPLENRNAMVFSSDGTSYRFRSEQTTDDGTEIDARWRSPGLRAGETPNRAQLTEVELEYENDSASSATVAVSRDGFASVLDEHEMSLSSSHISYAHAPVRADGRRPQFELRTDGDGPRISRMWAGLRRSGRF